MNGVLDPKFNKKTLAKNQTAVDIVKGIGMAVTESRPAAETIKNKFYSKDPVKSCEKVFNYLKDPANLEYVRESERLQTAKPIQRIMYDGLGDCKHYTTFSQSILSALGIPCFVRLVSQKKGDKEPTHIYTVALLNGQEYVIDPCMSRFDKECYHYYKADLKQRNMALQYLNGADDLSTVGARKKNNVFQKAKQKLQAPTKKPAAQIKKNFNAAKQKHDDALRRAGKQIQTTAKKFAVINKNVAKRSFLNYISVNGNGFATRLKEEYKKDPAAVKKFWARFGNWEELRDAINKGARTGAKISGDEEGGSSQAAAYEEGAKQSMGIIKMLIEWFKERKAKKNGDDKVVENMEGYVDKDPNINYVDQFGDPVPKTDTANYVPPPLPAEYVDPNVNPTTTTTNDTTNTDGDGGQTPTAGSFGLVEINSVDTFLHWGRGCMVILLAFNQQPLIGVTITIGSFIYLTRKKLLNAFTS